MDVNSPATIDEYIFLKIEKLKKELEIFQKDIKSRYPDEAPYPYPVTYLDWDKCFNMN